MSAVLVVRRAATLLLSAPILYVGAWCSLYLARVIYLAPDTGKLLMLALVTGGTVLAFPLVPFLLAVGILVLMWGNR